MDAVSKNKIFGYLNKHALGDLYYDQLCTMVNMKKKYNDIDFLDFFVNTIYKNLTEDYIVTNNMLEKLFEACYVVLEVCIEKEISINDNLIIKIKSFEKKYKDYCEDKSIELNKNIVCITSKFDDLFKQLGINIENINEESILTINELEERIKILNNIIDEKSKLVESLNKKINKLNKDNEKNNEDYIKVNKELKEKESIIKELRENIKVLNSIKSELSKTKIDLSELEDEKSELKFQNIQLEYKLEKQENILKEFNDKEQIQCKLKDLCDFILELLVCEVLTFNEIVNRVSCKFKDEVFSEQIIYDVLMNIGSKYCIKDVSNIVIPEVYGISVPRIDTNKILSLNVNSDSCVDIMLISDLHIKNMDRSFLKIINLIYEYCSKNNINYILDLGDFLDSNKHNMSLDKCCFDNMYNLLDNIIRKFPIDNNINHLILGGNHDKDHLIFGVDPIEYISNERRDIINLGYDNSILEFNGNDDNNEFLGLHHKGLPIEVAGTYDLIENPEKIKDKMNNYYSYVKRNYEDSYIDLFGHAHKSRLDVNNKYCIVPSLTRNNILYNNGAWHLKVYFDSNKKIKYMIFMPLSVDNKISVMSENVYKKIKKL